MGRPAKSSKPPKKSSKAPAKNSSAKSSPTTAAKYSPGPSRKSNSTTTAKSSAAPFKKSATKNTAKSSKSTSKLSAQEDGSNIVKIIPETDRKDLKLYRNNYDDSNNNVVLFFNQSQKGRLTQTDMRRMRQLAVIKDVKSLKVIRMDHLFERRVTSLTWHPNISNLIGLASKGGGMVLANVSNKEFNVVEEYSGIGPGGSILALKFHPSINEVFFTASLDGTVCYRNYQNKLTLTYLNTDSYDHWFTSFDMSEETGVMLAGDTKGNVTVLNSDGKKEIEAKIHKTTKIHHIEFCPRNPWLFVTTSGDKSVKLWDLRKFKVNAEPLLILPHERPINSAHFSRTDNNYLLTTDQGSELRVFQAPHWDLINVIPHPHRQFQHITPIKATWHPLEDIVVCGRYPDKKFPGTPEGELPTVDFMCPITGQMLYQLHHPRFTGLLSLNQFNNNGTLLGTGAGSKAIIWGPHPREISEFANKKRKKDEDDEDEEEEELQPKRKGKKSNFDMPSTSRKILDSRPGNRRCSKTDGKKNAKSKK